MAEGCRLMGIARSTYYDQPETAVDDTELVETMGEISDSFEAYGYRRLQAALRQRGIVVNHKEARRLMREHDLQPRIRRRFIATTDSDHELPIFPNLAKNVTPDGQNQLWVSDITCVAIAAGFVYVAVILDAWSRKVVGYAIGRSIDARLTVAALKAAIERRKPPPSCVHHSDRGRNMPHSSTATFSPSTILLDRWAGAAIPTIMRKRKAS
ncbi:IS3 family transposase [Mesorhizobium sp. M0676]